MSLDKSANGSCLKSEYRLQTDGLGVVFGTAKTDKVSFTALEDVNIRVREGDFIALIGPSGCGKSTLLNVLGGLLRPSKGKTYVDGTLVSEIPSQVGYMFQKPALMPWMTIRKNVGLPLSMKGQKDKSRVDSFIQLVGLNGFHDAYPYQLSGGMRTRAELARLLIQDPEILLMDEPFGALDAQTRVTMQEEFLKHWAKRQRTVVMVTHDLHEALFMSDRIILMGTRPGRVLKEFDVGLARPRLHEEIVHEPLYRDLYSEIWTNLRQQALELS